LVHRIFQRFLAEALAEWPNQNNEAYTSISAKQQGAKILLPTSFAFCEAVDNEFLL